jgi:lycopene cyclase domain-containing protein
MHPHAAYWLIVAAPLAAVALLSAWPRFRAGYWRDAESWAPGLLAAGVLLAIDGVVSAAAGFWRFTDERFASERYLNLPAAEWLFFLAAVVGVRLLWYVAELLWADTPVRRPRLPLVGWAIVALGSLAFGLSHHDRARTVYVFALGVPLALLLASATRAFWTRSAQGYLGLGFALFLPMDTLMNAIGSFEHAEATRSGVELPYGVPVEDLGYMLIVLLLLRFLPGARPAVAKPGRR